jgi:hypothetical protein
MHDKSIRTLGSMIGTVAALLVSAIALNLIVRIVHTAPHVGDIVAFAPSNAPPFDDGTRLIVHRQDQFGCVLDLNVLRRTGGSLVIENQLDAPSGRFAAHWAGPRTSADAADCGSQADLIVDRVDLEILSMSAGGYGARPMREAMYSHFAAN